MTEQQNTKKKTTKQVVIKITLGVLLTVSTIGFIFSDIQSSSFGNKNTLRTVGNIDITATDLNRERDNITRMLGAVPQNPLIKQQIIEQAFENLTLRNVISAYTQAQGIVANQDEVAQTIHAIPAFHDTDGNFDGTLLKKILQSQGVSVKAFKADIAQNIIRENFVSPISAEFPLSQKIAKVFNQFAFEKINFTAYTIDYNSLPQDITKINPINDDFLRAIYEKKKTELYHPAQKDIEYATFDAQNLQDKIVISEKQITDFYNVNKDKLYTEPEQRKILQILLDDEKKSHDIYQKIKETGDFLKVAKAFGFKLTDINLGFVGVDDISDTVAQTQIFSANAGTVLQPIKTDFGYAIYFIEQIKTSKTTPLNMVQSEIKNKLFTQELADYLGNIQTKIDDDLAGGATLEEITQKYGSRINVQKNITADGFIYNPQILKNPTLEVARFDAPIPLQDISDYNVGDDIPLIQGDNGTFTILKITASNPQTPLSFNEAKESLKNQELKKQKNIILKNIVKKLKNDTNKDKICADYHIKTHDYTITRNGVLPQKINLATFSKIIFANKPNFYLSHINLDTSTAMVLGVNKIMPADAVSDEHAEEFFVKLQKNYDNYIQQQAFIMLRNSVTIENNDDAFNTYLAQEIGD